MSKKVRDERHEPDEPGTDEPGTNYLVDRVFAPRPRATPRPAGPADSAPPPVEPVREAAQVATELLARRPSKTTPPPAATGGEDLELTLRRQVSRLQRQLAEAQRELAERNEELATETERRTEAIARHDEIAEQLRLHVDQLEQLAAYEARTRGIEAWLVEARSAAEQRGAMLVHEQGRAASLEAQLAELDKNLEHGRAEWSLDKKTIEERAASEIAELRAQIDVAITAAEETHVAAVERLNEMHDAELAQLKSTHERSIATLRGELEPKVSEARTLAEQLERLRGRIARLETDAVRAALESTEELARDRARLQGAHTTEVAALTKRHAAELAQANAERDARIGVLERGVRAAETRAQTAETQSATLRETLAKLQRELADATSRATRLDSENQLLDERSKRTSAAVESLSAEIREVREQLSASERAARHNAMDRLRFVAYLEEGLAMLGALPPTDPPEISVVEVPCPDPDPDP